MVSLGDMFPFTTAHDTKTYECPSGVLTFVWDWGFLWLNDSFEVRYFDFGQCTSGWNAFEFIELCLSIDIQCYRFLWSRQFSLWSNFGVKDKGIRKLCKVRSSLITLRLMALLMQKVTVDAQLKEFTWIFNLDQYIDHLIWNVQNKQRFNEIIKELYKFHIILLLILLILEELVI